MRRLFLVRHAKTEPAVGRNDYARKLTDGGREAARRMAGVLAERGTLPETLIHSGAARAMETAEIFARAWPGRVSLEKDAAIYEASPSTLLALVRALPDSRTSVALVGHNPGMGELAFSLAGSGVYGDIRRIGCRYPTCAVTEFEFRVEAWDEIQRGGGVLVTYLTPAEAEA
jgi:phosphohistidine phosphatase